MTLEATHETLRASDLRIAEGVAELVHRRPERRNALSLDLQQDYTDAIERIEGDRGVRALLVTGSGGSFCAGGDVKLMRERLQDPEMASPDYVRNRLRKSHQWLTRLRNLPVPVVAAVDGPAFGAGFGLAMQADMVLASERAVFCASFARLGAVPDYGLLYTLPRAIGLPRAKELLLTARRVGAAEALQLGLVLAVHRADDLLPRARVLARTLALGPREAAGMTKSLVNQSFESSCAAMFDAEASAQALAMQGDYHVAALEQFARTGAFAYEWDKLVGESK